MLPWGRCQGRQCRAALHTHRGTAGPGSQGGATPGKRGFEKSKTQPRSEGKGEKHACEWEEGEEAPFSPWRAHLEQVWDRTYEETHTGGGGGILKEPWPTLEQRMSMRNRRGRRSNLPVAAGMGSRLRLRNGRVKPRLGERQREEKVGIVMTSPYFSLCQLILTGS